MKAQQILSIDLALKTMYIHVYDAAEASTTDQRAGDAIRLRLRQRPPRLASHHAILRFRLSSRRAIHRPIRPAPRSLDVQNRHASAARHNSLHRPHHSQPHPAPAAAPETNRTNPRLRPPRAIPATHRTRAQAIEENAAPLAARTRPPAQKSRRRKLESNAKTLNPRRGGHSKSVMPPCPAQSIPDASAVHLFAGPASARSSYSRHSVSSSLDQHLLRKFRYKIAAACSPFPSAPAIAC